MDRRIVIYENNSQTGKGEPIFSFGQHVNEKNNILERDIAKFILQAAKHPNLAINPMLVAKYLIVTLGRYNTILELVDFIFHGDDFTPGIHRKPLPAHCVDKECKKEEVQQDLKTMGV